MRLTILTSVFCLLASLSLAQVAQIRWDVQQDRPVPHDFPVWRGETVDLMPRLVQGTTPVAVTNAPVEFRYREDALPTNTYRIVTATVSTNSGVLLVRWLPDYDAGAAGYDYQIIVGSNAANPRCFGRIAMRGTIGHPAPGTPPPPVALYPTRADLQAASNALATSVSDITAMFGPVWELNQGLNAHTTSTANPHNVQAAQIGAYPTNNPSGFITAAQVPSSMRLWSDSADTNVFATLANGTGYVWRVSTSNSTVKTVALSADFLETTGGTRPAWTNHAFPVTDGAWIFSDNGESGGTIQGPNGSYWDCAPSLPPYVLANAGGGQGVATVAWTQLPYTNLVSRFALTNDIPSGLSVVTQVYTSAQTYYADGTGAVWRVNSYWRFSGETSDLPLPWPLTTFGSGPWVVEEPDGAGSCHIYYNAGGVVREGNCATNGTSFVLLDPTEIEPPLTVGYALRHDSAASIVSGGITVHAPRTDNPHNVSAAQVGAVATNDARYLAGLTNAAAFVPVTQLSFTNSTKVTDGVLNGTNGVFFNFGTNPTNYWFLFF